MKQISLSQTPALKSVQMADYLLSTTYKIVNEPKALLLIANHALDSLMASVSQLLISERDKKTIPPYHDNAESKLNSFKQYVVKKYGLQEYHDVIERINYLFHEQKKAPVTFSKDMKYVICSDQFTTINTVTEADVKNYIKKAKEFAQKVEKITQIDLPSLNEKLMVPQ